MADDGESLLCSKRLLRPTILVGGFPPPFPSRMEILFYSRLHYARFTARRLRSARGFEAYPDCILYYTIVSLLYFFSFD